ncbi:alpha/beta hydrolase [Ferviditalea candida]|uniref:Alpha/beta hydrolase n=1 Tax=Ferviditalea candida TaxID=3108399 RepID=A0ABU5ZGV7_9BACL|nr:alpha/beta hydrolase [Paenibacillaceae bacterium T2]
MSYSDFEWRGPDGMRIFACEWRPPEGVPVKAAIGIVHGMGEHSGRYRHVAEMLIAEGYAVLVYDQPGHGRTEGLRGHAESYEVLLDQVGLLLDELDRRYPKLPRFLYAHSMGGNVALNYLLRRKPKLNGAVVTGPWLKLAFTPPPVQVFMGRIMNRIYPKFTNKRPLVAEHLTSDPEMAKLYVEDPLGHGSISVRFFFDVDRAGLWALEHAGELSVDLLLMHGSDDQVTSILASKQFAERAGSLCTFMEWPGYRHELHNELGREEVFAAMRQWLSGHLEQH